MSAPVSLSELVTHAAWLKRLAIGLLGNSDAAADVVQSTLVAAWQRPPAADRDVRPWLAEVVRNQAHDQRRSEGRRQAREGVAVAAAAIEETGAVSAETLIGDLEIHRQVAEVVAALAEPYRSTVVLHYYEGLETPEIARRLGVAAGTVRWRIKEGLDRIRVALDRRNAGDRSQWQRALLPLLPLPAGLGGSPSAGAGSGRPALSASSASAVARSTLTPILLIACAVMLVGGLGFWLNDGDRSDARGPAVPRAPEPQRASTPVRFVERGLPRFAAGSAASDPSSAAAIQARADQILRRLLEATLNDSYEDFLASAGNTFKAGVTREAVTGLSKQHAAQLAGGYDTEAVGLLHKIGDSDLGDFDPGPHTVFLWKLVFRDGSDDVLATLFVSNGQVIGFSLN